MNCSPSSPPFAESDPANCCKRSTTGTPPPPRQRNPDIPSRSGNDGPQNHRQGSRPATQTAAELAEDLRRYLAATPVRLRRVGIRNEPGAGRGDRPAVATGLVLTGIAVRRDRRSSCSGRPSRPFATPRKWRSAGAPQTGEQTPGRRKQGPVQGSAAIGGQTPQ